MKKLALLFIAILALSIPARAGELSKSDTAFLATCEKVRAALVEGNLDLAKKSAAALGDSGAKLAASSTISEARAAFAQISKSAVTLAAGQPGYYIVHCPMYNLDWVQTSDVVGNPFGGADMRSCGIVKK